jgi:hypothetical protein
VCNNAALRNRLPPRQLLKMRFTQLPLTWLRDKWVAPYALTLFSTQVRRFRRWPQIFGLTATHFDWPQKGTKNTMSFVFLRDFLWQFNPLNHG